MTRLEKADKDQVKLYVKKLNGKIVNKAENATHVIAPKAAATAKFLTAIVKNIKLITGDQYLPIVLFLTIKKLIIIYALCINLLDIMYI